MAKKPTKKKKPGLIERVRKKARDSKARADVFNRKVARIQKTKGVGRKEAVGIQLERMKKK